MLVENAFQGVLTLLICIVVGFVMAKTKYLDESMEAKLSKLTLHFSVPCLLFLNCQTYISRELLAEMGWGLLIPAITVSACYGLGLLLAHVFRIEKSNRGLFLIMFSMANTFFIGLPVCLAIFGEESLPLVAAYFPFNMLLFWTLGAMGLAKDGGQAFRFSLKTLKNVFSPPLVGALLGAAFALLEIPLPAFIGEAMQHLGNLTTPITLLLAGCILARMGKDALSIGREGVLTLVGRFLVSPALSLLLCLLIGTPTLMTQVYTMESAMPVMTQSMLAARVYGANHKLAAQMITLTTILGLAWVPLLMWVLTRVVA